MRKQIFLFMLLLLSVGNIQPIHSQGFFKTLGKVAKSILSSDTSDGNSTSNTSSSNATSTKTTYKGGLGSSFTVDGINIKFTECERYGNNIHVYFMLTNTRASENKFIGWSNYLYHEFNQALSPDGKTYEASYELAGNSYDQSLELPSDVPIKCVYIIKDYDMSQSTIQSLQFAFNTKDNTYSEQCYKYELRDVAISKPNNTNMSNIICSHPRLYVQYNSCTRVGTSVVINLLLKNLENKTMKLNFGYTGDSAYDDNGNSYLPKVRLSSSTGTLEPEIPIKATITLGNVPGEVSNLSLVRVFFNNQFNIDIKNISIQ